MPQTPSQSSKGNILVIDDIPANLRLLTAMLKSQGYDVRPALNGKIALAAAQSIPPDLILLDIMMPDMDGYEVCRQLKAHPQTQAIPVVFLSALDETEDKIKAFNVGGADYITKPFQKAEVLARVKNQLQLYSLQKQLSSQNLKLQSFGENLKQLHRLNTTQYPRFEDLLTDYLRTGRQMFACSQGRVSQIEGLRYEIKAEMAAGEAQLGATLRRLEETYCDGVVKAQMTVTYTQIGSDEVMRGHPLYQRSQQEVYIGTPIWVNGEIYGTLWFSDSQPRLTPFTSQEIDLIELMAQSLGKFIASQQAELKRKKAEEEVQLLLEIIQGISEATDFDEALAVAIAQVCEKTGWSYGEAWVETRDRTALECSPSWYGQQSGLSADQVQQLYEFRQYSEALVFLPGEELPGRVWTQQQSEWWVDISTEEDDPFLRLDFAQNSGLKAALAVPILATGNFFQQKRRVLAVLVFFMLEARFSPGDATRSQDKRLRGLVTAVAAQLGRMMYQKQVEVEQRAMFAAMTDAVMVYDYAGICLRVAPTKTTPILSSDTHVGRNLHQIFPLETADQLLACIQNALVTKTTQNIEYSVTVGGEQAWLEASISPLNEDTVIWVVRDVSDRAAAQAALQASEARNRAIITAIPDLMFRMSAEGIYLDQIKSRQNQDLVLGTVNPVGKPISELYPSDIVERQLYYAQRALETGKPQVYEQEVWMNQTLKYEEVRVVVSGDNEVLFMVRDNGDRKRAELALRLAKQQSERLLLNILPRPIADRLKQATGVIAEQYDNITILFADIVGFTSLSSQLSPIELVNFLNQIFSTFDRLAEKYGLEKIKTIGDAYMVVGGLPDPNPRHAEAIADMALAMRAAIADLQQADLHLHTPLQIRIGISTGSAVAGVIGMKKFIYDLWGDTVNVASRMESQGLPNQIQVTEQTYQRLKDQYHLEKRGTISVKGKGEMTTYWLINNQQSTINN
ncbi:adenylate/guanylate cyclase domain-containing protein [Spirulina sp. CS-785/01]|uniref:adenylate/guanylate cyclase domain-containing protein n=1 Tax=Spirulina sp. CS-785/01 TaxID=3021716 RepID=UPI00232F7E03|nr:adenylate/guanylate cyclase domain-containing protein [Spirulina sp. CS-785/01]MDB9315054.1 adenylate/guanylate cyclase domain-containing protein [Spirulina sp. CS-785/01]